MRKWLVLGLVLLGMVWGPYVYTELSRSPEKSHGRVRHGFGMFGDSDDEEPATEPAEPEDPKAEPAEPPAEKKDPEPQPSAAAEPKPVEAPKAEPIADQAAKPAADPEAEDEPRPTWPTALVPAFHKAFETEPRDAFWAQTEEPKLRALFHAAGVTDDSVVGITCLKSVCRIGFHPDDYDADVETKIFEAVQKAFGQSIALEPQHGETHANLFVLREGFKLER